MILSKRIVSYLKNIQFLSSIVCSIKRTVQFEGVIIKYHRSTTNKFY